MTHSLASEAISLVGRVVIYCDAGSVQSLPPWSALGVMPIGMISTPKEYSTAYNEEFQIL